VFKNLFVAYPADEEFALQYVYARHRHWMKWKPWPAGLFWQNGKLGLMTVISAVENDFHNPEEKKGLRDLVERTEQIRLLLRADQKTFAGILPGILKRHNLLQEEVEAKVTAGAVVRAVSQLRRNSEPVIVIGGKGYLGHRIVKRLEDEGAKVFCVDIDDAWSWRFFLEEKKAIVVNVSKKRALSDYISLFWPGLIVLNEVYPAPTHAEISRMTQKGVKAFHLVGLKARALPSFPREYKGGIPCCAGWDTPDAEVILRPLN
jgi:hypothetical protein